MTVSDVMDTLRSLGNNSIKQTLMKHGAKEPLFGVKVEELKKLLKLLQKDQPLALELYDTGNTDAMYLAGLMADGSQMTKKQLQHWVQKAYWPNLSEYIVPWVTSESPHGFELAQEWIDSGKETTAAAGWSTFGSIVATTNDEELNMTALKTLLKRAEKNIHDAPNRVKYAMNGFVIALGSYVPALTDTALKAAQQIGPVTVYMGNTACKVPFAPDYINKVKAAGKLGKKRKSAKC
jgi:3-methyladenine DNA glycosylase AlkD